MYLVSLTLRNKNLLLLMFNKDYSMLHSNGNSVCGYVVLDGVNMTYRDEDNGFYQIYAKQIFLDFYYEHLNF